MTASTTIITDASGAGKAGASIPRVVGNRTRKVTLVSFDVSSYSANGEPLPTAASLNMQEITAIFVQHVGTSETSYLFKVDLTNNLLLALTATGTEATGTTNLGTIYLQVWGY